MNFRFAALEGYSSVPKHVGGCLRNLRVSTASFWKLAAVFFLAAPLSSMAQTELFSAAPSSRGLVAAPSINFAQLDARTSQAQGDDLNDNADKAATVPNSPVQGVRKVSVTDFGREFYYKNKTEFGVDVGWLPINIPFAFDIFLGDGYNNPPLYYTLMPVIGSLRWQISDIDGPWIFRGNWDLEASGAVVVIPRGPETRYFAWIMGGRRNFVPRRGRIAPYFDFRLGLGNIDAKEPKGVMFAQGENYTFTLNVGSGVRYNFNQKYAISAGIHYMHISNLYLSEPRYPNYGINVYGPMIGLTMRLGKPHHSSGE